MLIDTLIASLVINPLAGKGLKAKIPGRDIIRTSEKAARAGQDC